MTDRTPRRRWRTGRTGSEGVEALERRQLLAGSAALEVFSASAPAVFVENRGQWSDGLVRYGYQSNGAAVGFTDTGVLFQLSQGQDSSSLQSVQFAASFVGASATRPVGEQQAGGLFNFYVGDVSQHRSNVPGYQQVLYSNLYSGVDLYTYGQRGQLKYEFHVEAGADYRQVQIRYCGIEGLSLAADGSLHVQTGLGEMVDSAPVIYQEISGQRREVAGKFVLLDGNTYGFEVTGQWDSRYELVLDPELEWSTYLHANDMTSPGGYMPDYGDYSRTAIDSEGNIVMAGHTLLAGWVNGGDDTILNFDGVTDYPGHCTDIYVVKLSPTGEHLWSTYVGGADHENLHALAVNSEDDIIVHGYSHSGDGWYGGWEYGDFVMQFSSSGEVRWVRSTSDHPSFCAGMAVDRSDNVVLVRSEYELGSPANGIWLDRWSSAGAVLTHVQVSEAILWVSGMAMDPQGNVFVAGATGSQLTDSLGDDSGDGYVLKLSPAGQVLWGTALGSGKHDGARDVALDSEGNVLVTGFTHSAGWVSGGFDTSFPDTTSVIDDDIAYTAFVAKLSPAGEPLWSSYIGGVLWDGTAIAVDAADNVLVTGGVGQRHVLSTSWDDAELDGSHSGMVDGFVAKFSPSGSYLWGSYLGGIGRDIPWDITTGASGEIVVVGRTTSPDWISGGYQTTYGQGEEDFAVKLVARILLSGGSIAENRPIGTLVGTLRPRDPGTGGGWSYQLVSGRGSEGNGAFAIVGDQLFSAAVFDYEAQRYYTIRVQATGPQGQISEEVLTIRITNVNEAPTALGLAGNTVAENQPAGTVVGQLSGSDPDVGDHLSYSLVSGSGSQDNGLFAIVGDQLRTAAPLNYEAKSSYTVRVRVRDQEGLWFEQSFQITASDVNEAPTTLSLSGTGVRELQPAGAVVGNLSTNDPDANEQITYALVDGTGAADNGRFAVVGNELRTGESFDGEARSSYSIRVRGTDAGGLWVEKSFTISILPVLPQASVVGTPRVLWTSLGQRYYDVVLHLTAYVAPLDLASMDGDELVVTGPGGAVAVSVASMALAADGKSADVTYRLAAPGGRWDQADNGSYSLAVPAGSFGDTQGHPNRGKSLGQMGVNLPGATAMVLTVNGTPNADTISITLTGSGYTVNVNGMGYSYAGANVRSIQVSGYAGNDRITITGPSYICEVSAGAGNDTITGGSGDDLIRGDEDQDVITGGGGDDTLYGNFGNDSIIGEDGADSIMGGLGADTLDGGLMGDWLYGGDQSDLIYGKEGADYIEGRGKADTLYGGSGNDTIYGGAGSDLIYAQGGNDQISVGLHLAFADTVDGGAGYDSSDQDANDVLSNVESVLA